MTTTASPNPAPASTEHGTPINDSTRSACEEHVLNPRFYTTDFDAMDAIDVSPVRREWDQLMEEFRTDRNKGHFNKTEDFSKEVEALDPELKKEFLDFLTSSVTSEYSGCVLYSDIKSVAKNPDIKELMQHMARDEARHAGFINQSLKDFGLAVDLGFLRREKKKKFFRPKFIFYATYLSEKIGYARYISIYRQLEKHPERRFHPIFNWFLEWCNDEYRHGEAFALIMRSDPDLLRGINKYWIRFFIIAVYATMYCRDHNRPAMHRAFGIDPTDYDYGVFRITNEISKQTFPITVDIDNPVFHRCMERLRRLNDSANRARAKGGLASRLKLGVLNAGAALTFARLYFVPVQDNTLPEKVCMAPAW